MLAHGFNQYQVVGETGNQIDPCDGQLHSYPVEIPVQENDVLGADAVSAWGGFLEDPTGSVWFADIPEPKVSDVIELTYSLENLLTLNLDRRAWMGLRTAAKSIPRRS